MSKRPSNSKAPKPSAASAPDPRETARSQECPFRERGSCIYLNQLLGWSTAFDIDGCDACWKLGGPSSHEGVEYLVAQSEKAVADVSTPANIAKLPRSVLVPLTLKHRAISLDTFKVEAARSATAHAVAPLWQRAGSLLGALKSKFTSTLSPEDHALRHISCMGTTPDGTRVADPCPSLKSHNDHFYCGACGCGFKWWAAVDTIKLSFPQLPCPRNRPGFTPP